MTLEISPTAETHSETIGRKKRFLFRKSQMHIFCSRSMRLMWFWAPTKAICVKWREWESVPQSLRPWFHGSRRLSFWYTCQSLLFLWRFSEHSQFGKGEIIYVIWIGKFLEEPEHFVREMDVWNILFSLFPMLRCYRYCMCRFDLDQ